MIDSALPLAPPPFLSPEFSSSCRGVSRLATDCRFHLHRHSQRRCSDTENPRRPVSETICFGFGFVEAIVCRFIWEDMDKLLEFGRKACFIVRVMSGYEERRIRAYRLQLQQRIEQAQARKVALRKLPEQVILSEVRRMVEQMQSLNRQLEETESAIEEYLKPIDKNAHMIMNMQLEKEEEQAKEMIKVMQQQVMLQQAIAYRKDEANHSDLDRSSQELDFVPSEKEQSKQS